SLPGGPLLDQPRLAQDEPRRDARRSLGVHRQGSTQPDRRRALAPDRPFRHMTTPSAAAHGTRPIATLRPMSAALRDEQVARRNVPICPFITIESTGVSDHLQRPQTLLSS